jgi:PLP dependent protein
VIGEESKSGCEPSEALDIARHIISACSHLTLQGLMTIGAIARSKASEVPNEDFLLLRKTRDEVAAGLGLEPATLELSMGMSEDFEQAVKLGASEVR